MTGHKKGSMSLLRKVIDHDILHIHCMALRQHLVAKELSVYFSEILSTIIRCVNTIKRYASRERQFKLLCKDNDEELTTLILHTEVRWLSKTNCLTRFKSLFHTIIEYISTINTDLSDKLIENKPAIMYLSDIFKILSDLNLKLQGKTRRC